MPRLDCVPDRTENNNRSEDQAGPVEGDDVESAASWEWWDCTVVSKFLLRQARWTRLTEGECEYNCQKAKGEDVGEDSECALPDRIFGWE
jgi:hypothetical protein